MLINLTTSTSKPSQDTHCVLKDTDVIYATRFDVSFNDSPIMYKKTCIITSEKIIVLIPLKNSKIQFKSVQYLC